MSPNGREMLLKDGGMKVRAMSISLGNLKNAGR
jgi:hypothetical protein